MSIENGIQAEDLFEQWRNHCQEDAAHVCKDDGHQVKADDFETYRYIWQSWIKYIQTRKSGSGNHLRWDDADGEAVVSFLNSGVESRSKRYARVSDITKRRYWRVLDRIYTFAMEKGFAQLNPASQVMRWEIPKQENHKGHILTPKVWDAALHTLRQAPVVGEGEVAARNRALLLVLFTMGLMPIEVRSLNVDSYVKQGYGAWLNIEGGTDNAKRQLEVPSPVRDALDTWIVVRGSSSKYGASPALFTAQTGKAMTDETLLQIVRAHLVASCATAGEPLPQRLGPQIIRNTRIVKWLMEGVPRSVVVLRAGLKNEHGLDHLASHVRKEGGPRLTIEAVATLGQMDLFQQAA